MSNHPTASPGSRGMQSSSMRIIIMYTPCMLRRRHPMQPSKANGRDRSRPKIPIHGRGARAAHNQFNGQRARKLISCRGVSDAMHFPKRREIMPAVCNDGESINIDEKAGWKIVRRANELVVVKKLSSGKRTEMRITLHR